MYELQNTWTICMGCTCSSNVPSANIETESDAILCFQLSSRVQSNPFFSSQRLLEDRDKYREAVAKHGINTKFQQHCLLSTSTVTSAIFP